MKVEVYDSCNAKTFPTFLKHLTSFLSTTENISILLAQKYVQCFTGLNNYALFFL